MMEYGTTVEQMASVSVKNHMNAFYNPYAQKRQRLSIRDVRNAPMVAWPLTRLDICVMSDGAAVAVLASEEGVNRLEKEMGRRLNKVRITGIGRGTDAMRMADRPHRRVPLLPMEKASDYVGKKWHGGRLRYPGIHSFRAGRTASIQAYRMAGIENPLEELDFVELHDAYTSSEIQTYEDMGLCRYGEGGKFAASGKPFLPNIEYGLARVDKDPKKGLCPVNPSGGLIACGHPVGATGLMQAVFAFWQLQHTIRKHLRKPQIQVRNARRGAIHSHAGTGTYVTVTILEAEGGR
jgi:acetyl-CoA C-acetyltransferase